MTQRQETPESSSRSLKAVLALIGIAVLVSGLGYWWHLKHKIQPVTTWHDVQLGMSDLDVTLAFGRKPDCTGVESSNEKELVFNGRTACSTSLSFRRESDSKFKLVKICTPYFAPADIDNYEFSTPESDEKRAVRNLGEPSFTSINKEGTTRLSSFARYNVAFAFENEQISLYCVTTDMPVRFSEEYSG